jgi:hypothetical protein
VSQEPKDAVDLVLEQWRRERPDLDLSAMGVFAHQTADAEGETAVEEVFVRHGLRAGGVRRAGRATPVGRAVHHDPVGAVGPEEAPAATSVPARHDALMIVIGAAQHEWGAHLLTYSVAKHLARHPLTQGAARRAAQPRATPAAWATGRRVRPRAAKAEGRRSGVGMICWLVPLLQLRGTG